MKRTLSIFCFAFIALNIYCQINFGKLGTDVLVDNSVKGGISIIKSEYQLKNKKDGSLYGRGGKDVYNVVYQVGINLPTGIMVMNDIRTPWETDKDFDKYRNNESYEPVLKTIKVYSKVNTDSVINRELALDTKIICNADSSAFLVMDTKSGNQFITRVVTNQIKDSWILWFAVDKGQKLIGFENLTFNTVYQRQEEEINGKIVRTPLGSDILLCGILLAPHITGIGKIELHLAGIINKDSNNWKLNSLPNNFINMTDDISTEAVSKDTVDDELTPIESKNKAKSKPKSKKKK